MNVKMMAGILALALAGGCAHVALLPDEHLWAEGHKVSVPQLPPVPADAKGDDGRGAISFEAHIIAMTASCDRQVSASKLNGKKVGPDEIQALIHAADDSASVVQMSTLHVSLSSGTTQGMDLNTTGSYVSDYALQSGVYAPVLSTYFPDANSVRMKATLDGDTVVLDSATILASSCSLVQCTATFRVPSESEVPKVTITWFEPIQEKHTATLKESVRLKVNEGVVFELPGILERGVSNLRVPMKSSQIKETGYTGAGGTTERMIYYAIIVPVGISPTDPKTAMVAH
jgi:hypothetical protein